MNWLEPWESVEESEPFEAELVREMDVSHPLFDKDITAIARRFDCDDVLFQIVDDSKTYFAVVHLTWTMKTEAMGYPRCEVFDSLQEFETSRMVPDHEMF